MVLKRRASLYHRKKLKRISESFLDTACQVIGDYYGIGIESSDLEKCLLQYEDCRAIRSELRINSPSDTSCREWMISEICEYIGVNYWPCYYMDDDEFDDYKKEFQEQFLSKFGYECM